jgi:cytochrome c553
MAHAILKYQDQVKASRNRQGPDNYQSFLLKEDEMKKTLVLVAALMMAGTLAYAANADKGKILFESPRLGGGTTGKSCASCHEGGKGLGSDLFERKQFTIMKMEKKTLADVVNVCIENPLGGKAIDPQGQEMQDLIAYMKTLVTKPAKKKTPKKIEGC